MPRLPLLALGLLLALPAAAHDFWIEPTRFEPAPGEGVALRLFVGEHFRGDAVARPAAAGLHRFVVADANGPASAAVPGRPGGDPAGLLRLARPGAYVVGLHGKPNRIELPADRFNAYLELEGLQAILALRAARGQTDQPAREIYSRCAKSLLLSGPAAARGPAADRALGFPLELIAERRPETLPDGDALPVRLLYEGQPLAGALVVALRRADPARTIERRSDAEGRVRLPLSGTGPWLVKAVHMRPAAADSGADWESLWASLTFAGSEGAGCEACGSAGP